jgi:LPS export ABC transporter protein LptC
MVLVAALTVGCSFNYGSMEEESEDRRPDLTMSGVEYVRVRDGDPLVRVQADRVERYERTQMMRIDQLRFEQYAHGGDKAAAAGSAGSAVVQLESGDTELSGGVQIVVESEDLTIETSALSWRDDDRLLVGGGDNEVLLKRSDGAVLSGRGFMSDARRHSWEFSLSVSGTYIDDDEDKTKDDGVKTVTDKAMPGAVETTVGDDATADAPEETLKASEELAP